MLCVLWSVQGFLLGDLIMLVQFVMRLGDAVYVMLCAGLCAGRSEHTSAVCDEIR